MVPISGGGRGGDSTHPRNVLLIYASGDPERIRFVSRQLMAQLTDSSVESLPHTSGDPATGTGRRLVEVPGHDHVSILFSETPVRETVSWLRAVWGLPAAPFQPAPLGQLREGLISVLTGVLLFFPVTGFLAGAVLRTRHPPGTPQRGGVLMAAVAFLLAGVPLFAGVPLSFLPYMAGNELLSYLLIAGVIYGVWLGRNWTQLASEWSDRVSAVVLGGAAFLLVYATFGLAVSRLFFNVMLSSQRAAWFVVAAVALLPLGIALEAALRPPGGLGSVVRSLAAKGFLIVGLIVAVSVLGTVPPVVGLIIPSFMIILPIVEALAARLYTVSGSPVASGVLTALLLAWIPAAIFPIAY